MSIEVGDYDNGLYHYIRIRKYRKQNFNVRRRSINLSQDRVTLT